jgi:hypothetical protein
MNSKTRMGSRRSRVRTRPPLEREDVALQSQLLVLTPQPRQLVAFGQGQAVTLLFPAALLAVRLRNPVADRLHCRFELARKLSRIATGAHLLDLLATELRRIRRADSWYREASD